MKLFFVFFLFVNFSFGQTISGEVTYKVKPPQKIKNFLDTSGVENPVVKKSFVNQFHEAKKASSRISYRLKFNTSEAIFKGKEYLPNDNGINPNHAWGLSEVTNGTFYTNSKKHIILHQFEAFHKTLLLKRRTDTINWTITKQAKIIKGYRCIKATTTADFHENRRGEVIAWFCPDLPFQFGPIKFGGLPGLILGMKFNSYYVYANEIRLSGDSKKIKPLTTGEAVTKEEYYNRLKKKEAQMRNRR